MCASRNHGISHPQSEAEATTLPEIAAAWRQFVTHGSFHKDMPREYIANSWQQCMANGVDPESAAAPMRLSSDYLRRYLKEQAFGQAGKKVLDSFAGIMDGTGHAIVLGDAEGQLLYTVGNNSVMRQLEQINFMPGASWDERHVGPNGIGSTLSQGRADMILGAEHFCENWQPWVCYGAPVRAPGTGLLVGAVDITGPVDKAHQESLALTMSIAQNIEQVLTLKHLHIQYELQQTFWTYERRWPNDGLVLFHTDGGFLNLNARAARLLGIEGQDDVMAKQRHRTLWTKLQIMITTESPNRQFIFDTGAQEVDCQLERISHDAGNNVDGWLLVISERQQSRSRGSASSGFFAFEHIYGDSPLLKTAIRMARAASQDRTETPVLIHGETGTGKEMFAQAIHQSSDRSKGPFVAINCGALPADLVESELFGYVGGAFTGARVNGLKGKFEIAQGGTLFLDEVDSMPLAVQVKLLRVIETREVTPLGSNQSRPVDFRLVTASGRNLIDMVGQQQFRADLYHRLAVLEISIPPLRERGDDINGLAQLFIEQICIESGRPTLKMDSAVREALASYAWPGNIRELHNVCRRWVLTVEGDSICVEDLPVTLGKHKPEPVTGTLASSNIELIRSTLAEEDGNISKAAERLGIARSTLYRQLRKHTD